MALIYPSPTDVATDYRTILKTLKPEVNVDQEDSDWWIRSQVVGGVFSGIYADQRKIADDAFPQNARREALQKHLQTYFGRDFNPPQPSIGDVMISGPIGGTLPAHTQFIYGPNGNTYQSILDVTLTAATGVATILSDGSGQSQNLLSGVILQLSSPPAGFGSSATAVTDIADGKDEETNESAAAEILAFIQQPPAGGTAADYIRFGQQADPSVVDVSVIRFLNGLGTLGMVITAGTTNIDSALNNGQPVVREPSQALIDEVQAYVNTQKVETDCVEVFGPQVLFLNVTVKVRYVSGTGSTIEPNTGLTQDDLVRREVKRAIYKTPPGGRRFGGQGFVVASEIEEVIDLGASAAPYTIGTYAQILSDRDVLDLSATGPNLMILPTQLVEPGTITVTGF